MNRWLAVLAIASAASSASAQTWVPEMSGTTASLRGVHAVSAKVAWASGTEGTWLRTLDGGAMWRSGQVPGAETLDFRGVRAVDERSAYLLSSGPGDKSRVYKTGDAGLHWTLLLTNPDAEGFFDAIAFWNAVHGILVGDPVEGRFAILTTTDAGRHWTRREAPTALPKEGLFAASNSCLTLRGDREAWFATGGPKAARVFHSTDGGETWTVAATPIRNDSTSAGIFSIAFSDGRHGVAIGGDYAHDRETKGNAALTSDGGLAWQAAESQGYRSAVVYLADRDAWLAVGSSGSDVSRDGGKSWTAFDGGSLNAVSAISSHAAWAVGPKGRIAKLAMQ